MTIDSSSHTYAARLTAETPAAIATIAVLGPSAAAIVACFLGLRPSALALSKIRYATWHSVTLRTHLGELAETSMDSRAEFTTDPDLLQPNSAAGEQLVVCRTGDDQVEIHCHGGKAVSAALLADLAAAGCILIPASEWPSDRNRALARAAEQDLLLSTTDRAAAVLLDQAEGALDCELCQLSDLLNSTTPSAAVIPDALAKLNSLLAWADFGLHLSSPWRVVLAGPPNVGKSSLMNALLGTRGSIVHHLPGTTSDWIECQGAIDGWPVAITDTAGIRETEDEIEAAGIHRALERLRAADLAIFVVDAQQGWTVVHEDLLRLSPLRRLIAWNKVDLRAFSETSSIQALGVPLVCTSAVTQPGMADLLAGIAEQLVPRSPQQGQAVPFRDEQVATLRACYAALESGRADLASNLLSQLVT